jgi:alkylhydroperoxidase family enzyme
VLLKQFMDADELQAVIADRRNAGLDETDVAIMDLAEKVAADATSVTQADVDRLRSLGLSDAEIVDVVLAAAARCFFSKTLDALGARADERYSQLDPEIREALTVGHPIAAG